MPDRCNFVKLRFNFSQGGQHQLVGAKVAIVRSVGVSRRERAPSFNAVFIYNPNITRKLRQRRPNRPTDLQHTRSLSLSLPPRWNEPSNVKCHQLVSVSPTIFSISPIVSDGRADGRADRTVRPSFLSYTCLEEERRSRVNRADIDSPGSVVPLSRGGRPF